MIVMSSTLMVACAIGGEPNPPASRPGAAWRETGAGRSAFHEPCERSLLAHGEPAQRATLSVGYGWKANTRRSAAAGFGPAATLRVLLDLQTMQHDGSEDCHWRTDHDHDRQLATPNRGQEEQNQHQTDHGQRQTAGLIGVDRPDRISVKPVSDFCWAHRSIPESRADTSQDADGRECPPVVGSGRFAGRRGLLLAAAFMSVVGCRWMVRWRRGRDSNPRYAFTYAAFRVRYIQPLCHLSARRQALGASETRCVVKRGARCKGSVRLSATPAGRGPGRGRPRGRRGGR